jgi:hypothetical protein
MKGSDERIASVQKAMEVNKEAIDKAVGATEKGVKDAVSGIKTDVEKALKMEMNALKTEITAMEKIVTASVANMKDSLKMLERLVFTAMAVFIFGKQIGSGVSDVFEAAAARAAGVKGQG